MDAILRGLALSMLLTLAGPAEAQTAADLVQPEAATGLSEARTASAERQMVVAANPHAVAAGLEMLRDGGSAADALVAVQTVLGLVEPQSSGLGGGAFLLWYDAEDRTITTFDGRETAPAAAASALFLDETGEPLGFFEAVVGGRSVGTPGVVRLMEMVHRRHGRLAWEKLFEPAIALAENGFQVSPRLARLIAVDVARLGTEPSTRAYFFDGQGAPLAAGTRLVNRDYAATLRKIATEGAAGFYEGAVAEAIVAAVQGHAGNPGILSLDDLAAYEAHERPPVCLAYRDHTVCGMGSPSSGGLTVGQILGMVSHFDLAALGPEDPQSWRVLGDATRLAFADRGHYMADSDFVSMPKGLLEAGYLAARARLLFRENALPPEAVVPGEPPWDRAELRRVGINLAQPATSHFVIVDSAGNVASMTSSIENAFGARLMAAGFLLNNQLTDFSFLPDENGRLVANRVEPRKRPRSSMSPTIILKEGQVVHALGSPGGSAIIPFVANTIVALIDWNHDMAQAIAMPHRINRFGPYELEAGTDAELLADDLEALGYQTEVRALNSGLHGVTVLEDGGLFGAADPRREGIAAGD
jgi:gamma-glutamyltranspeptidase/glutathione hydrolase